MILSRVPFRGLSPRALRLAGDPNRLHAEVIAWTGVRGEGGPLFRIDKVAHGFDLLLLSREPISFRELPWAIRDLRDAPEHRPFAPLLREGDRLAFRLLARPSKRLRVPGPNDGPRRDLRTDEERLAWLAAQGAKSGFAVVHTALTPVYYGLVKDAVQAHLPREERVTVSPRRNVTGSSFGAVRFDGELTVTDSAALLAALPKGFGPQKAFGFGLLTLARMR